MSAIDSLFEHARRLEAPAALSAERVASSHIVAGASLHFNWAASACSVVDELGEFAERTALIDQYRQLRDGKIMNTGERRSVDHHLLRAEAEDLHTKQRPLQAFFASERQRVFEGAEAIRRSGRFSTLVHIGIGGSALGPILLNQALDAYGAAMEFIPVANVDPDEMEKVVRRKDLSRCLFLVVTKSGTTQETLENLRSLPDSVSRREQVIVVTTPKSALNLPDEFLDVYYMKEGIGGRFSLTSVIGACVVALLYGAETFLEILKGARDADQKALCPDLYGNAALIDAMLGLWYRIRGHAAISIIPYASALGRLPAYLQQLDMESNGKHCSRSGEALRYKTGPVVFGEPGTDAQHSFFQLLHQGSDIVPVQFVGFRHAQLAADASGKKKQRILLANLAAQIVALVRGQGSDDPAKRFDGGRPVTLLLGDRLDPAAFGALIAHYENKIMFQGFAWDINSFDQEGVQLGKKLARAILEQDDDELLQSYATLLEIPHGV